MLDYDKQRKLVALLVVGIVVCVIVTIIALILIWMPENDVYEYKLGVVQRDTITDEEVIKTYSKNIIELISNKNYNAIYNLLAEDYIEYKDMTLESLKQYLEDKGVTSNSLELIQYKEHGVSGYNNVYELELKVRDEVYSVNVIVREIAPNNYKIAFDGFIDYNKNTYSSTVSSVTLDIKEVVRFTTLAEYKIRITNGYNKGIYINNDNISSPIFLVSLSNEVKRPTVSTVPINKVKISSKLSNEYLLKFDINDVNDYTNYVYMVISGVSFENMEGVKDLQYLL